MGMFDRIWFMCPGCGGMIENTSKAGYCELKNYIASEGVPEDIYEDIKNDEMYCEKCDKTWSVFMHKPLTYKLLLAPQK